jgi:hypothetical protein
VNCQNKDETVAHDCGFGQIEKKRLPTPVVLFKMEKAGQPHLWFGPNQEKEPNHTRGRVQNGKRRPTTLVVRLKK